MPGTEPALSIPWRRSAPGTPRRRAPEHEGPCPLVAGRDFRKTARTLRPARGLSPPAASNAQAFADVDEFTLAGQGEDALVYEGVVNKAVVGGYELARSVESSPAPPQPAPVRYTFPSLSLIFSLHQGGELCLIRRAAQAPAERQRAA